MRLRENQSTVPENIIFYRSKINTDINQRTVIQSIFTDNTDKWEKTRVL